MKEGFCKCPKIVYIWYDGFHVPAWKCPTCKSGITWGEEE
jgi:hypothetical protein